MTKNKTKKIAFSKWLNKLQQESWQLELLISGFVIFALLESLAIIPTFYESELLRPKSNSAGILSDILRIATYMLHAGVFIFLINLIIHILIRSLWIGAIGLRYVSGDIDYDHLNYSSRFLDYYKGKIGSFDRYIQQLENFASILFSFTFLLFFILLSLYFYLIWFVVCISFVEAIPILTGIVESIFVFSYLGLGFLVAIDFLSLGLLKKIKNKYFSAFYLPIYRFFSTITLSFLWRPMLLNFLDQPFTRRLFIMTIPYLLFLGGIFGFNFTYYGHYPDFQNEKNSRFSKIINQESFNFSFYAEERDKHPITDGYERRINFFSIPSKTIAGSISEIFVKAQTGDKWLIEIKDSTITSFQEEGIYHEAFPRTKFGAEGIVHQAKTKSISRLTYQQNLQKSKAILKNAILLHIDNQPIAQTSITCDFYQHPHGNAKGLLCYFPLDSLKIGRHYLKVAKVIGRQNYRDNALYLDTIAHTIPFIYEGKR